MRKYRAVCDDCDQPDGPWRDSREEALRDRHRCTPAKMRPRTAADVTPEHVLRLANACARAYRRGRTGQMFDLDEMVGDAAIAGWRALSTWNPDGGANVETYLWRRMTGSIIDGLRERGWLSRVDLEKVKVQAVDGVWDDVMRPQQKVPARLDALLEAGYDAPDRGDAYDQVDNADLARSLLAVLTEKERDVVVRNVMLEEKLRLIGESYGVTEARACQIKAQALDRMFTAAMEAGAA